MARRDVDHADSVETPIVERVVQALQTGPVVVGRSPKPSHGDPTFTFAVSANGHAAYRGQASKAPTAVHGPGSRVMNQEKHSPASTSAAVDRPGHGGLLALGLPLRFTTRPSGCPGRRRCIRSMR
jgi:hypothetical protein